MIAGKMSFINEYKRTGASLAGNKPGWRVHPPASRFFDLQVLNFLDRKRDFTLNRLAMVKMP